jgi:adenine-specific DNA-methyltransferase
MSVLFSVVKTLVDVFNKEELHQSTSPSFEFAVEAYIRQITLLSKPYQHHRTPSADRDQLISRFKWETVLFSVVSGILEEFITLKYPSLDPTYICNDNSSLFAWYQIPDQLKQTLKTTTTIIQDLPLYDTILELSEICGQLLPQYTNRGTGEFYTPRSLAKHLISISGLKDDAILSDATVIDPSCGGGIVLLSIAINAIQAGLNQTNSPQSILKNLVDNIYGYDIQPFAIDLTHILLNGICAPLYASMSRIQYQCFRNVLLFDPLTTIPTPQFDYVIGNPPYLPVKREQINFVSNYNVVLNGHVNLYALFLWWAVQAASSDGIISFLVPQTLLSGLYFQELRVALDNITQIRAVTRMTDRKGVVGDADQQVMAVCLQKTITDTKNLKDGMENRVNVIVTHNGTDIEKCIPVPIPQGNIVKKFASKPIWIISEKQIDYAIQEAIESQLISTIRELAPNLVCQNGGFVWNQHPEAIRDTEGVDTIPLISSSSIAPFRFMFPYSMDNPHSKRAYAVSDSKEKVYRVPSVLIQRVTSRKTGRRLIATITSEDFTNRYPKYFVENHVNTITCNEDDLLFGVAAWINSDIMQFLFQMRNGNAQISVYELHNLPCSAELLLSLASKSRKIFAAQDVDKDLQLKRLNIFLFKHFKLTSQQISRISSALSGKVKPA